MRSSGPVEISYTIFHMSHKRRGTRGAVNRCASTRHSLNQKKGGKSCYSMTDECLWFVHRHAQWCNLWRVFLVHLQPAPDVELHAIRKKGQVYTWFLELYYWLEKHIRSNSGSILMLPDVVRCGARQCGGSGFIFYFILFFKVWNNNHAAPCLLLPSRASSRGANICIYIYITTTKKTKSRK